MKFASIKPNDIAVIRDNAMILVGNLLAGHGALPKNFSMLDVIADYDRLGAQLSSVVSGERGVPVDPSRLKPPVANPSKIWAAAGNYKRGTEGLGDARGRGTAAKTSPQELLENIFLKPPSSIAGPEDNIVIPKNADSIFPELELCVVIGRKARNLSKAQAMSATDPDTNGVVILFTHLTQ